MTIPGWQKEGQNNIWLPYTQMKISPLPLPVISADGIKIKLADGSELIDGISSWWTACHGYSHPHIIKKMSKQLEEMPHIMFGGLAHKPAYELAQRLTKIVPSGLTRVFFSDSGSTAVEVALKIAVQYWGNKGDKRRNRFICFRNGYHGDTMGGMSLSDPDDAMHKPLNEYMPRQFMMDIPYDEYSFSEFEEVVKGIQKNVAGLIIEPLVQCAGGMKFHSADILAEIYRICKKYDIIFIADEVATGFGRTGMMFACEEAGITPDIMCIGKALTGGAIGMAATLATENVFAAFLSDRLENSLMHGPTYMANPLACSAAIASIDLFEKEPRLEQVEKIEEQLDEELGKLAELNDVKEIRVKGAIGVVELKNADIKYIIELRQKFVEEGVWLRPFNNIIYMTPPFIISPKELSRLTRAVRKVLTE